VTAFAIRRVSTCGLGQDISKRLTRISYYSLVSRSLRKVVALDADQCRVSPVAVTRARAAARAASSARTLRMMNRPQPSHANGFRFRRARRLFFCVAAGLMRVLRFLSRWFKCGSLLSVRSLRSKAIAGPCLDVISSSGLRVPLMGVRNGPSVRTTGRTSLALGQRRDDIDIARLSGRSPSSPRTSPLQFRRGDSLGKPSRLRCSFREDL
jgi:hypothetical protein